MPYADQHQNRTKAKAAGAVPGRVAQVSIPVQNNKAFISSIWWACSRRSHVFFIVQEGLRMPAWLGCSLSKPLKTMFEWFTAKQT